MKTKLLTAIACLIGLSSIGQSTNATVTIKLEWDANPPEENVTHYKVYHGPAKGQYAQVQTVTTTNAIVAVQPPSTNWFAVSAVNNIGLESDLSEAVSAVIVKPSIIRTVKFVEFKIEQTIPAE